MSNHNQQLCWVAAIQVLADNPEDFAGQIRALEALGFETGEANRIAALAPQALSRPVIEKLGTIHWPTTIQAVDEAGETIQFELARQPEFDTLLGLARHHLSHGFFDHASFQKVVISSAETNCVNRALNEGEKVDGAVFHPSTLNFAPFAKHLLC